MSDKKKTIVAVILGVFAGFINGFFGGGGGMIVVPMLTLFLKMPTKKAHATALAVILPVSLASAIFYAFTIKPAWVMTSFVTLGFTLGGSLGALLLKKLNSKWVSKLFAFVILAAGIKLLLF